MKSKTHARQRGGSTKSDPSTGKLGAAALGAALALYLSPLGRGFLTGTVQPGSLASKDFRADMPRFQAAGQVNLGLVGELKTVAQRKGCSPA